MQEDIEELRQKRANLTVQLGLLTGRKNSITAMKGDFSPALFLAIFSSTVTMRTECK